MNEIELTRAVSRAEHAQRLLDDVLLNEAFDVLEKSFIERWRATGTHDTLSRERLFQAVQVTGLVRQALTTVVGDGVVAKHDLDRIAEAQKRKRLFGFG